MLASHHLLSWIYAHIGRYLCLLNRSVLSALGVCSLRFVSQNPLFLDVQGHQFSDPSSRRTSQLHQSFPLFLTSIISTCIIPTALDMLLFQTTFLKLSPLYKYYSISLLSFQQNSFKWVVLTIFNSSPPNFSLAHNVNEIALVTLAHVLHSAEFYFQFSVNWNFNSIWHTDSIWPCLIFCTTLKYSIWFLGNLTFLVLLLPHQWLLLILL